MIHTINRQVVEHATLDEALGHCRKHGGMIFKDYRYVGYVKAEGTVTIQQAEATREDAVDCWEELDNG